MRLPALTKTWKPGVSCSAPTLALALLFAIIVPVDAVGLVSPAQRAAAPPIREVRLLDLPGVRRLFDTLSREWRSMNAGEQAAAWTEFSLLVAGVVGDPPIGPFTKDDLQGAASAPGPLVRASTGVITRDGAAYQLQALGYSARETADVVSGRIGLASLDTALKMLMAGRGREVASDYLDSQYKRVAAAQAPRSSPPGQPMQGPVDAAIEQYAGLHGVDPSIVRAIIAVESAGDVGARSRSGAVGLMQLMPGTARALGVDPSIPEQNIAGGVRYLSALIEIFGGLELALVAYNAGPGFARRYVQGQVALYGETREYVKQVLSRIPGMTRPR